MYNRKTPTIHKALTILRSCSFCFGINLPFYLPLNQDAGFLKPYASFVPPTGAIRYNKCCSRYTTNLLPVSTASSGRVLRVVQGQQPNALKPLSYLSSAFVQVVAVDFFRFSLSDAFVLQVIIPSILQHRSRNRLRKHYSVSATHRDKRVKMPSFYCTLQDGCSLYLSCRY